MPVNVDNTLQQLTGQFAGVTHELSAVSEQLMLLSETLQTEIADVILAMGENFANLTSSITETVTNTFSELGENLSTTWNELLNEQFQTITESLIALWQEISPIFFDDVYGFISSIWSELLTGTLSALSVFIQDTISFTLNEQLTPFIEETLSTTLSTLTIFIQESVSSLLYDQLMPYIQETIQTILFDLRLLISDTLTEVKETVTEIWSQTVTPIYDDIKGTIINIQEKVLAEFAPISALITTINGYLDNDWKELKRLLNQTIEEVLTTVRNTVIRFAGEFYMGARESISSIVNIIGIVAQAIITYLGYDAFGILGGVAGWFGGDYVKDSLNEAFKNFDQQIVESINPEETQKIERYMEYLSEALENGTRLLTYEQFNELENWDPYSYAEGGIPDYGQLFIAREAGPEFVGSFGSRNVVMNNDQIVTAVSGGVYNAVRRANAEQTQQPIYLNVEAKVRENVLFDVMETVKAERGVRLSKGGSW